MAKSLLCSLLLLLAAATTASAQMLPQWELVSNDQDYLANMNSVIFTSHDTGYLFSGAKMVRTTDSGMHFTTLKLPNSVSGLTASNMAWPTNRCGYVAYSSVTNASVIIRTNDAGDHWAISTVAPANAGIYHISFPSPAIGYATGAYHSVSGDDSLSFAAVSMDSGKTWILKNAPAGNSIKDALVFHDAGTGLLFDIVGNGTIVVNATYDGGMSVHTSSPLGQDNGGTRALYYINAGTWIANPGVPGELDRTTDSGRTWTTVVKSGPNLPAYAPSTGAITQACFNGDLGFAFMDLGSTCFGTTDGGANWMPFKTTNMNQTHVLSMASGSSFPTNTVAYVLGTDSATLTDMMLLKLQVPPPVVKGVQAATAQPSSFIASVSGAAVTFTAPSAPEARLIEVLDLLGRPVVSTELTASNTTATLARAMLRPGTYFARMGNACAKFTIAN